MIRSFLITLLFAVAFILAVFGGSSLQLYAMPSYSFVIIAYMAFMTVAVLWIIQKQNDRMLFSQAYLASIVFKILTGLALILVIIRLDPKGASGNAALFILSYIAFTGVEIACLLATLRSEKR